MGKKKLRLPQMRKTRICGRPTLVEEEKLKKRVGSGGSQTRDLKLAAHRLNHYSKSPSMIGRLSIGHIYKNKNIFFELEKSL